MNSILALTTVCIFAICARAGPIQIGNEFPSGIRLLLEHSETNPLCNSTSAGVLFYNEHARAMQYCDGSILRTVHSSEEGSLRLASFETVNPKKLPLHYYDMESSSSGQLQDLMSGNHLATQGEAFSVIHDCPVGKCFGVQSCTSYFESQWSFHARLLGKKPKSLTGWMRAHNLGGDGDGYTPLGGFGSQESGSCSCSAMNIRYNAQASTLDGVACGCDLSMPTSDIAAGQWHFYAVTFDGTNMRVYLDGANASASAERALNIRGDMRKIRIGANTWDGNSAREHSACHADYDDIRIYDYQLDPSEVQQLYELGTPPALTNNEIEYASFEAVDPVKRPYYHFDMSRLDASGRLVENRRGNNLNLAGTNTFPVADCPVGECFGVSDCSSYFESWWDFNGGDLGGSGPKTLTGWMRAWSLGGDGDGYTPLGGFGSTESGSCVCSAMNIRYNAQASTLDGIGCGCDLNMPTTDISPGQWHFYAVTFDGTDMRVYLDGGNISASAAKALNVRGEMRKIRIAANTWNGHTTREHSACHADYDDIRIYNYKLEPSEIEELYGLGSPPEPVNTEIFLASFEENDVAKRPYYHFDMSTVDASGRLVEYRHGNNLNRPGSNTFPVSDCPIGECFGVSDCSSYFESWWDFNGAAFAGTGPKSLTGWMRVWSLGGDGDGYTPLGGFGSTEGGSCVCSAMNIRYNAQASTLDGIGCGCDLNMPTTDIAPGQWHFYAVTFDGTDMRVYLDGGNISASAAKALNVRGEMRKIRIAANTWNGHTTREHSACHADYDDVRIYNYKLEPSEIDQLYGLGSPPEPVNTEIFLASFEENNVAKRPYYHFDMSTIDASGRLVEYRHGNNLNRPGSNSFPVSDCPVGGCFGVSDCSSYFESWWDFNGAALAGTGPKSLTGWMRVWSLGGDGDGYTPLGGFGSTEGGSCVCSAMNIRYNAQASTLDGIGCGCDLNMPTTDISPGQWHFYAVTFDGTDMRVYLDGGNISASAAKALNVRGEMRKIRIAANTWNGHTTREHSACHADYDDVRIYNYKLEPSEIDQLYGLGSPPEPLNTEIFFASFEETNVAKRPYYHFDMSTVDASGRLVEYRHGNNLNRPGSNTFPVSDCPIGECFGVSDCSSYFESWWDFNGAALAGAGPKSLTGWMRIWTLGGDGDGYTPLGGFGSTEGGSCVCSAMNIRYNAPASTLDGIGCGCDLNMPTTDISAGQWHFYAVTFDGTNMRVYLDGGNISASAAKALNVRGEMRRIRIAANTWNGHTTREHSACHADYDDIRIYNYKLEPSELDELFNMSGV